MGSDLEGWFNLPKSVKLLDISLVGYAIALSVSIILYLNFLDHSVQNLMPIFLTAILLLFTWNLRTQLLNNPDLNLQKNFFRNWFIICLFIIIIVIIITLVYPVTY
jgi:SNF family Na+-dependent transporter